VKRGTGELPQTHDRRHQERDANGRARPSQTKGEQNRVTVKTEGSYNQARRFKGKRLAEGEREEKGEGRKKLRWMGKGTNRWGRTRNIKSKQCPMAPRPKDGKL